MTNNNPKPRSKPLIPVIPSSKKTVNLVPLIPSTHNSMHPSVSPDISSDINDDYYGGMGGNNQLYVTPGGPSGNSFKLSASVMQKPPSIASHQPSFEIHSSSVFCTFFINVHFGCK